MQWFVLSFHVCSLGFQILINFSHRCQTLRVWRPVALWSVLVGVSLESAVDSLWLSVIVRVNNKSLLKLWDSLRRQSPLASVFCRCGTKGRSVSLSPGKLVLGVQPGLVRK